MSATLITTEDLYDFKMELLEEFKKLLQHQQQGSIKMYLKSSEVMELLQISPGTLQNLRANGVLPFHKVGGIIFYDTDDIQKVMDSSKVQ